MKEELRTIVNIGSDNYEEGCINLTKFPTMIYASRLKQVRDFHFNLIYTGKLNSKKKAKYSSRTLWGYNSFNYIKHNLRKEIPIFSHFFKKDFELTEYKIKWASFGFKLEGVFDYVQKNNIKKLESLLNIFDFSNI